MENSLNKIEKCIDKNHKWLKNIFYFLGEQKDGKLIECNRFAKLRDKTLEKEGTVVLRLLRDYTGKSPKKRGKYKLHNDEIKEIDDCFCFSCSIEEAFNLLTHSGADSDLYFKEDIANVINVQRKIKPLRSKKNKPYVVEVRTEEEYQSLLKETKNNTSSINMDEILKNNTSFNNTDEILEKRTFSWKSLLLTVTTIKDFLILILNFFKGLI